MGAELNKAETAKVVDTLKHILELELAGLVRYLHYSFMVFGHNRIPIVAWLRSQADESQAHAVQAGEHITSLGGHPSLKIGPLLETHKHNVDEILREALAHEEEGLGRVPQAPRAGRRAQHHARGVRARADRRRRPRTPPTSARCCASRARSPDGSPRSRERAPRARFCRLRPEMTCAPSPTGN